MRSAIGRVAAAAVLAVSAGLAHQAAVRPVLEPATIDLIDTARRPLGRAIRAAFPDLTPLGDSPAIVTGSVTNGSETQRVRVMLGSVVRAELELSAGGRGDFALELPSASIRATAVGDERYGLYLAGDHDDWQLDRLQASNVHGAVGSWLLLAPVEMLAEGPGSAGAWLLLAGLAALAVSWGRREIPGRRTSFGIVALIASALAFALLWALPLGGDRRFVVAPAVFWPLAVLAFAPSIAAAHWRRATAFWRRHQVTCERGAMLVGLTALAVAQPVFDVLQGSPEFFIARNTTAWTALAAVVLVLAGVPLVVLVIERMLRAASPAIAAVFAYSAVGVFIALMVHPWLKRADVATPTVMAGAALAFGAAVAWLVFRSALARAMLAATAPAAIVVPFLFFASPTVAQSFTPSSSNVRTPPLASTPPVVFVVFDEFPLLSLLDDREEIDAVRFPSFAALAREATWFREASAVSSQTVWAVPAIASGRYPVAPNAVPTLRYYPQNLFTLLADRYRMHVFGRFLQLCPESACERDAGGPSDGPVPLLLDLGVVWLHVVAPGPLTEYLPPVVGDWAGFARAGRWRMVDGELVRDDRRSQFDRFLAAMRPEPARLYFLHSLLPHMGFEYTPSERTYAGPDYQQREEGGLGLFQRVDAAYADAAHQRHLLQVGFVDTLVGRLMNRLRELGIWDDALVVITADHGASYREGMPRRTARTENLADIVRVPLFIKRPGQRDGAIVDGVAESVDILPSVADALGAALPFQVDGRSLFDSEAARRSTRTFISRSQTRAERRNVTDWRRSSDVSLTRRISRFGVGSFDQLYAVPGTSDLIGRPVDSFRISESPTRVRVLGDGDLGAVDLEAETLPLHVRGRVYGRSPQPLAIAVNGRIAATTIPFVQRGTTVFATMIPEQALRAGANEIATFFVEGSGSAASLLAAREPD